MQRKFGMWIRHRDDRGLRIPRASRCDTCIDTEQRKRASSYLFVSYHVQNQIHQCKVINTDKQTVSCTSNPQH